MKLFNPRLATAAAYLILSLSPATLAAECPAGQFFNGYACQQPTSACPLQVVSGTPHCVNGGSGWWYVKVGGAADAWVQGTDSLCATAQANGNYRFGSAAPWGVAPCMSASSQQACEALIEKMSCDPSALARADAERNRQRMEQRREQAELAARQQQASQMPSAPVEQAPPITVTFFNQGGYVARFSLGYYSGPNGNTPNVEKSGNLAVGQRVSFPLARGARDLEFMGEYSALGWKQIFKMNPRDSSYAGQLSSITQASSDICIKTWGTVFSPQWGPCN